MNGQNDQRDVKKGFLQLLPVLFAAALSCAGLYFGFVVIPVFVLAAAGAFFAFALSLNHRPYMHLAPVAVFAAALLFFYLTGTLSPWKAVLMLVFYTVGFVCFALTKQNETRSNIVIAGAVGVGIVLAVSFVCFMVEVFGGIGSEEFGSFYTSVKTMWDEITVPYARKQYELALAVAELSGSSDAGVTEADYLAMYASAFRSIVCLVPAIFICLCNISSYLTTVIYHRLMKKSFPGVVSDRSKTLSVGVPGAYIYVASYFVYAMFTLFSDSTPVFKVICENLFIIYIPALFLVGFRLLFLRKGPSFKRSTFGIILLIIVTVISPQSGFIVLAFIGAFWIVTSWTLSKIARNNGGGNNSFKG